MTKDQTKRLTEARQARRKALDAYIVVQGKGLPYNHPEMREAQKAHDAAYGNYLQVVREINHENGD